jgi:hypothetical protein
MVFADIPSELTEETFRWGKYHAMAQSATVTALISGPLAGINNNLLMRHFDIKLQTPANSI